MLYYESAVTIKERHGANTDSCTVRDLTLRVHGCLEVRHAASSSHLFPLPEQIRFAMDFMGSNHKAAAQLEGIQSMETN